ncbi:MAG: thiol-disulfide isomerase [Chthoniobacteraceae bacterium]|nr:thiol-disulfide isomerase [Chthoniobacteraceae bacterium]
MNHYPDKSLAESAAAFEKAAARPPTTHYVLRLFVAGTTRNSVCAITNLKRICEQHLANRYQLEIIDIYQQPELAREAQLTAVPTLIKQLPLPIRRIIGDLSSEEHVLAGLNLLKRAL